MKPKIRLLLVDDHSIVLFGLKAIFRFEPEIEIIDTAENGPEAIQHFREHRPDVVLMDLKMPGMDGIETARAILAEFPEARILILTTFECEEDIHRALQAGVAGYVLKELKRAELTQAIRTVFSGERYLQPGIAKLAAERAQQPSLSNRQLQVLDLVTKGLTNQEIAEMLGFTKDGTKRHLHHIYRKLGVSSRAEATAEALKRGLV